MRQQQRDNIFQYVKPDTLDSEL